MARVLPEEASLLTDIMLMVFRVNGRLLERGDELVGPIGLTSARWQVLGAIDIANGALSAPQIAENMGVTRQGAQKQLNLLLAEGLVAAQANPRHLRSPLYALTLRGRRTIDAASALHAHWAKGLARNLAASKLKAALEQLATLLERLAEPVPAKRSKS